MGQRGVRAGGKGVNWPLGDMFDPSTLGEKPTALGFKPTALRLKPTELGKIHIAVMKKHTAGCFSDTALGLKPTAVGFPDIALGKNRERSPKYIPFSSG